MNDCTLERIWKDTFDTQELSLEEIPALMMKLATVQSSLSARLLSQRALDRETGNSDTDKLLNVTEGGGSAVERKHAVALPQRQETAFCC